MCTEDLEHWGHPRLILVATNLADRAGLTLQAISQARSSGAGILLVHVIRPASLRTSFEPRADSAITSSRVAAAWDVLDRTARAMERQGLSCEPLVLEGDPLKLIPELVKARDVDRVIVATAGTHPSQG